MNKIKSTLILIFLATTGCSSSISDLEDKIEAQAVKNNVEISYAEIKNSIIMTIGNHAVTHLDLLNEIKLIAILSNTKVDKDNSEEIKNLAIKSIITKTLKNQEINRIGITTYNKKDLQNLVKGTAENLGLNKQEMKELLEKHNLSFDDLVKKSDLQKGEVGFCF